LVVAFNLVGAADLILNCYHAVLAGLPALAGELGATYAIPIIYVPVLMITHFAAFYLLVRPQPGATRIRASDAATSLTARWRCRAFDILLTVPWTSKPIPKPSRAGPAETGQHFLTTRKSSISFR